MNRILFIILAVGLSGVFAGAEELSLSSPDGKLTIRVAVEGDVSYSIAYDGEEVVASSRLGLMLDGVPLPRPSRSIPPVEAEHDGVVTPVVPRKMASIPDRYRELRIPLDGGHQLQFRAYDDGAAYRYVTGASGQVEVTRETVELNFPEGSRSLFPEEESILSHNERLYLDVALGELGEDRFCSLPVLIDPPGKAKVLFTEADLFDYPGMFLRGAEGDRLTAKFPAFVLEARAAENGSSDRNQEIVREAEYIARTAGARGFPWRVFIIGDRDGVFVESELVYLLSRELAIEEPEWIRPGRVAWDWYNACNLFGVDFASGLNTETYRYYIDLAAEYGLEYIILDEGWSASTVKLDEPNPDIDLEALIAYGADRGVGIILWALWGPIERDRKTLFPLYEEWGVKGVKIDFMQRNDQTMVNFYTETAALAARHLLLVDFHGAFKPSGLRRAYPNVITYEGVKGSENNKWSAEITPSHNVTIPYIRMAAGPMDYTPGAMVNAQPHNFRDRFERPMSMGTRAHEVAKYVVYESPLQMLCDSPSMYRREAETTAYISRIPTVWDSTKVLEGEVGKYILVARSREGEWYVGAMTNEEERTLTVNWSILPSGTYDVEVFADGINAHRHAEDYRVSTLEVRPGDRTEIRMAPGGGWVGIARRR